MIEINLLPEELKKKQRQFKKIDLSNLNFQNIPFMNAIYIGAGVLIFIQIALFFMGLYSRSNLTSLEGRYKAVLPQKKEADKLKLETDDIKKKVKAIDELMVNRFDWARKLNDLSDSMIQGIWLTGLHYDEKIVERAVIPEAKAGKKGGRAELSKPFMEKVVSKYLIISGCALNAGGEGTASVGKFIKTLKDNHNFYSDFSDIQLGSIKRDKVEDQEAMSFTITCLFK